MKSRGGGMFWHRAGPMAALAVLTTAAISTGCGSSSTAATGTSTSTGTHSTSTSTGSTSSGHGGSASTSTSTTTGSSSSGGGSGSVSPTLAANQVSAFDATPDPTGATLYFTGLSNTAGAAPLAGVYSAPANGSATTPTAIAAGAPYVSPFGISSSTDGKTLYVADPGADIVLNTAGTDQVAGGSDLGAILVQAVAGGAPTVLTGTTGWAPQSVEVNSESGSDVIYFTGHNPTNGKVGVYKTVPAGGTPMAVLEGAPLAAPLGLAIGTDGTIFVADAAGPDGLGQVISITSGGTGTQLIGSLNLGFPSGVALSMDESQLFVSTLDPAKHTDVLLQITIASKTTTPITANVTSNMEAAGIHRAHTAEVFAWADGTAGSGGAIYTVK